MAPSNTASRRPATAATNNPPSSSSSSSFLTQNGIATVSAATAPAPKAKQTLRILCFGDSLTAGYSSPTAPTRPYAHALTARLSTAFPSLRIETVDDGKPGDIACSSGGFIKRMEPRFMTVGGTPFDWTVVLGGTNDLAHQFEPVAIFEALRAVWAVPLSRGSKVLALTVPEAAFAMGGAVGRRRDQLNALIRGHKQENFHVFDLHSAVPQSSMRKDERKRYWMDDTVHLTAEGYDLMGEKIAAALVDVIMPPGRLQTNGNKPAKRRKLFKDDDKKFEEEQGDEKLLNQGYVVVRWDDLA